MDDRERKVLEAAERVFSRYGVKRVSMSDLAAEAGVSRQTLYKAFRNKDDVFRALIREHTKSAIARIEAGLRADQDLGRQLDLLFAHMTVAGFDQIRASPHAQDIVEGFNASSHEELEAAAQSFRVVIERILLPYASALERSGTTVAALSDLVHSSARAAKLYSTDRKHLLERLETLKQLCLVAADRSS